MEQIATIDQVKMNDGAKNYSTFINSFTTFLIHSFDSFPHSEKEKISLEQLATESLFLLEKLHMHILYSFCIYEKYFKTDHPLQSNQNYNLLKTLQQKIKDYPFLNDETKSKCEKIISQILTYYPHNSINIKIILSPISPPWIAEL